MVMSFFQLAMVVRWAEILELCRRADAHSLVDRFQNLFKKNNGVSHKQ